MPPLQGFSDNPFRTREDFKTACISLLRALKPYQSPGGARIRLPLATGTHFDDVAAQLEGYARPLWAVGALLHRNVLMQEEKENLIEPYIQGLANGTDPNHPEYWGPVVVRDQRMVEMEIISFALLVAPDAMFHSQPHEAQRNIRGWLGTINRKDFPTTNWLWFRVMTNLALVKVCGVPYEELKTCIEEDLDLMEQFYLGEGWAADGVWSEHGRQADYYSGSFAIQFSQLIYAKMAEGFDPERCARFRVRAVTFASSFWRYFDKNGATIPFGRSLTYRFAFAGFWSAAAFAEVDLPAPLNAWGVVKGLLLRQFRWWSTKPDMFNMDGTLTIGFTYPNMYMSEDYNSPQSPYWALKSFIALSLPATHPFWTAEEKPLPATEQRLTTVVKPPSHIVCHTEHHHFLLSTGQFCPWPLKATEAKYGKFAYSSHFGFSVPTGPLLAQMAPDNTLALSKDGGDIWRVPWRVSSYGFSLANLVKAGSVVEKMPMIESTWKPWKDMEELHVFTALVAPCSRWPDWYIRRHVIFNRTGHAVRISAVQGGLAIQGRGNKRGEVLPSFTEGTNFFSSQSGTFPEGILQTPTGALICSNAGASGILALNIYEDKLDIGPKNARPEILKPDANTSLMWQRTLIPIVKLEIELQHMGCVVFASAVFAAARREECEEEYGGLDVGKRWEDVPVLCYKDMGSEGVVGEYIFVD